MENKIKLSIEGMHCEACVRRVTNALNSVEGVHVDSVEVGSANVTYTPETVEPGKIAAAVNGVGFTARIEN